MAYRENKLGLLARLNPSQARDQIVEAFEATDDGKPGRAGEKAAKYLDVGRSTLTRLIKELEDSGFKVKRPGDDEEDEPAPVRKKTKRRATG